ncbi:MAG: hypothetical protein ACYTF3_10200, partial [Planctomycetota bacterium]
KARGTARSKASAKGTPAAPPRFGRQLDIFDYMDPGGAQLTPRLPFDEAPPIESQATPDAQPGGSEQAAAAAPTELAPEPPAAQPARGVSEARSLSPAELALRLKPAVADARLSVALGRARSTPIQYERRRDGSAVQVRLRLHRCFAGAPDAILDDLGAWLRAGKRARAATARLDAWMEARLAAEGPAPIPARGRQPKGAHHDLAALSAQLWLEPYARGFLGQLERWPTLGWGRRASPKGRRRLQLAAFESARHWIRVSPVLDADWVPGWFVKCVLFHELLHAVQPEERDRAGRVRTHGPWFRRAEHGYPLFAASKAWEQRHLTRLLRG